ncbi:putative cob(II)yrinic acid a,c-diamide reductase [Mesorhizobium metallidurans STM 2683]|uniref:Putative cob(II)yrinic acid a,c-diamide reductase n=1 Tax=Mesorhizobium metallidurans STM 2683 TaxID=1297569 RepID=M5EPK3_9HYPH|nr:5,6-dimethylbenzimidazole synthase [Mesorhizobium metallidurans]CCV06080.1 putative cob(II)yrinic acid a,c-diamide reductase [Mesorhizobium metallidurans STM 2683]
MTPGPQFPDDFRAALVNLFLWRRDVRRFEPTPLPEGALERLLGLASIAPSVGLSQPWRFVVVESPERREAVKACFERCNAEALTLFSAERAALYARLKLAGLNEAPCQFAVFADHATGQGHGLGRMTMPATIEYSAVMAVHTLWLAARAEGIGMGWVSILDPAEMATILDTPPLWTLIGYFCVGYPSQEHSVPELEREGWEVRRPPTIMVR